MKQNIYSIYDRVSKEYAPPFLAKNDGMAKRMFTASVHKDILPIKTLSVDDFGLYVLGEFDTETAQIQSHLALVCSAEEVLGDEE